MNSHCLNTVLQIWLKFGVWICQPHDTQLCMLKYNWTHALAGQVTADITCLEVHMSNSRHMKYARGWCQHWSLVQVGDTARTYVKSVHRLVSKHRCHLNHAQMWLVALVFSMCNIVRCIAGGCLQFFHRVRQFAEYQRPGQWELRKWTRNRK